MLDKKLHELQVCQYVVDMMGTPGWTVLKETFKKMIEDDLNLILTCSKEEVEYRRGMIYGMKRVLAKVEYYQKEKQRLIKQEAYGK